MNQIDADTRAFLLGQKLDLVKLAAPFEGDDDIWRPGRDHSVCTEEDVLREVAAISTAGPGDSDWMEQIRYVKREVLLVGLPRAGAGMVSAHEWEDDQFTILGPTFEEGDELEWVETLLDIPADEDSNRWYEEPYPTAENILAALVNHPEACDYTMKANSPEVRDHLFDLARLGDEARQRERDLCGIAYRIAYPRDEDVIVKEYKKAMLEW